MDKGLILLLCFAWVTVAIMEYLEGNLIARHVMNLCSEEETANLQNWLNESEQNRVTYGHLKNVVHNYLLNHN